jgi:hypothetical protein
MAQPQRIEIWTGPYSYLDLTFQEQNKAIAINDPLEPGYIPAACYLISDRGDVKLWRERGEAQRFSGLAEAEQSA